MNKHIPVSVEDIQQFFSIDDLAGQRLMVGFDGTDLNEDMRYLIHKLRIGGVILFSRNLESPKQIKELCGALQSFAAECRLPPLFIAIDQEGGQVARLKPPFTQFPGGNPAMRSDADAQFFANTTAHELKQVGVNMDMAPVLDVLPKGFNGIMEQRVFGDDPQWVAHMGTLIIRRLQENGIMAVAKHFPGIGRTTLDSHIDMPFLDTDQSALEQTDLVPFQAAIDCNVAGVMLSHIFYSAIDNDWPASLSERIASGLLRQQMGFEGVVMTDDLDMGAINKRYDIHTAVNQLITADVDIALICHKGPDIQSAYDDIRDGLTSSTSLRIAGIQSVHRIMSLKNLFL